MVAQRLHDLGVPFVVFSGSDPKDETRDPVFLWGEWLAKPSAGAKIVETVLAQLARDQPDQ